MGILLLEIFYTNSYYCNLLLLIIDINLRLPMKLEELLKILLPIKQV